MAVDFKRRRPCLPSFSFYFHVHRTGTSLRPSALVLRASRNRVAPEYLETTYVHAPNATREDEKRDALGNREKDAANRKLRMTESLLAASTAIVSMIKYQRAVLSRRENEIILLHAIRESNFVRLHDVPGSASSARPGCLTIDLSFHPTLGARSGIQRSSKKSKTMEWTVLK